MRKHTQVGPTGHLPAMLRLLCLVALALSGCKTYGTMTSSSKDHDGYPTCPKDMLDPDGDGWGWNDNRSCYVIPVCNDLNDTDGDGWGWENNQSCRMTPACTTKNADPDGDGWGWENEHSCKPSPVPADNQSQSGSKDKLQGAPSKAPAGGGVGLILFNTTYYPYAGEHYFKTACGDANNYSGMYFAVSEKSPVWNGECNNDSWASCADSDCLGKWDRMPADVKRWTNGNKEVREPSCDIPCGQKFNVYSENKQITATAAIYDACPSQHWNNRFKEYTEGVNPCAKGAVHVDLRKPLYLHLNGGKQDDNIKVWIDTKPLP